MDIKAMLDKGLTAEEIYKLFEADLAAACEEHDYVLSEKAKAEEAAKKREITLNDARAHLISALGLYNEVFNITEFTDEDANDLAEALKEVENFMIKNPDLIKMYVGKDVAKSKYKSSIFNDLDDGFWRILNF